MSPQAFASAAWYVASGIVAAAIAALVTGIVAFILLRLPALLGEKR